MERTVEVLERRVNFAAAAPEDVRGRCADGAEGGGHAGPAGNNNCRGGCLQTKSAMRAEERNRMRRRRQAVRSGGR